MYRPTLEWDAKEKLKKKKTSVSKSYSLEYEWDQKFADII